MTHIHLTSLFLFYLNQEDYVIRRANGTELKYSTVLKLKIVQSQVLISLYMPDKHPDRIEVPNAKTKFYNSC